MNKYLYIYKQISNFFLKVINIFLLSLIFFCSYYLVVQKISNNQITPKYNAYTIVSNSMIPNIDINDIVVMKKEDIKNIKVNDIITYKSNDYRYYGVNITHRVVGIVNLDNNKIALRTKGDNNNSFDNELVDQNQILGKLVLKIPKLGFLQRFVSSKIGFFLLIILPLFIFIIYKYFKNIFIFKKRLEV